MASQSCKCGHQKRDHTIGKASNYGSCKICLCDSYRALETKVIAPLPVAAALEPE
jgi:hypothetical protein